MGSTSYAERLGVRLTRTTDGVWADPSGIRSALRRRLSRPARLLVLVALSAGLVLGLGSVVLLLTLVLAEAALVAIDVIPLPTHRLLPADLGYRAAVAVWPLMLVVLGAAVGTPGGDYHGELVGVLAVAMAGTIALAEPTSISLAWSILGAVAVAVGGGVVGGSVPQVLLAGGSMIAAALAGERARDVLEEFLGTRQKLLQDTSEVTISPDPFVTAELLLHPLTTWLPLKNPSIVWFTNDGRSVFLAVAGQDLPPGLRAGKELPRSRNDDLRAQAAQGPWISGWAVRGNDAGYSQGIANLGIKAIAYVPLLFEGRVIGVVGAGLDDVGGQRSAMAEHIPALVEYADAAAVALGPGVAAMDQRSETAQRIESILASTRFRPVFQPVRDLRTGVSVGFEALTRFDDGSPDQIFGQARMAGRYRDLELATLRAALQAARGLPSGSWLSINCSADLMTDPETLAPMIDGRRDLVIELSEHDPISDYRPLEQALGRLGDGLRLAVDDAGAGFASLRHILEVRPAFVKLDLGLVQGVARDLTRTALVTGLVRFAGDAGFELIAEGIETDDDHAALRDLGVGLGQGYLLGRPSAVESW